MTNSSTPESRWEKLLKAETLKRGWHLAKNDSSSDFVEDLRYYDIFALDIDNNILDCISSLRSGKYQPSSLLRVDVPKGTYGNRPGSVINIRDRIVLHSIIFLIAEELDSRLDKESVYSWRTKDPYPNTGKEPIFYATDMLSLPYLKKRTIMRYIEPFKPWYTEWPKFDLTSRSAFEEDDYRYLVTSDIAAYFENIQLSILRDLLLKHLPDDQEIVNLLIDFLECWTVRTSQGARILRGIPQGSAISSFLGNFFLLPLDDVFIEMRSNKDIKYFRYMDDVRIFTRDEELARKSVIKMEKELRRIHLNLQTAKTHIYDQKNHEISSLLIDTRIDKINEIINSIDSRKSNSTISDIEISRLLKQLESVARIDPGDNEQKLLYSRKPFSGLSLRTFRRWVTASMMLGNQKIAHRLIKEITINPNYQLTRRLVRFTRLFPQNRLVLSRIKDFLRSPLNTFEHQEAECLWALRYLSQIDSDIIEYCRDKLLDSNINSYVRVQAANLLSRLKHTSQDLDNYEILFNREEDISVKSALASILVQKKGEANKAFVRSLVFHPNDKLRHIGKLFRTVKNDPNDASDRLRYIFSVDIPWKVCDNLPFLYLMMNSEELMIREKLANTIRGSWRGMPIVGLRPILKEIYTITANSLRNSNP